MAMGAICKLYLDPFTLSAVVCEYGEHRYVENDRNIPFLLPSYQLN